jgi:hypothetical protein
MSYLRYMFLFVGGLLSYLRHLCLFVGGLLSYLRYLCLFAHNGVQPILCFGNKDESNIVADITTRNSKGKTHKWTTQKAKKMSNTDNTKNTGVNPGAREG